MQHTYSTIDIAFQMIKFYKEAKKIYKREPKRMKNAAVDCKCITRLVKWSDMCF